jgi:hypothetical protein
MLTKLIGQRALRTTIRSAQETSADNGAATITLAAVASRSHFVHHLQWSYNGSPSAGRLFITSDGVTKFDVDVTTGGPGGFGLELIGGVNETVVITLAAGGAGVIGKLNVQYTTESNRPETK